MATQKAVKKMLQVRTLLEGLQEVQHGIPTVSWQGNKATKVVLNNPSRRKGSQHIGRAAAKAQQWVDAGPVTCLYCRTNEMAADVFTKPLAWGKFSQFRKGMMNLVDNVKVSPDENKPTCTWVKPTTATKGSKTRFVCGGAVCAPSRKPFLSGPSV